MYYIPPRVPKLAVIFVREGDDLNEYPTAELQEENCRRYCRDNGFRVSHSVRVRCGPEESLEVLRYLLRTLPPEVDAIFAARFYHYSTLIPELGRLSLVFQCRRTWVYSLDIVGVMYKAFNTITGQDYDRVDQYYQELIQ